MTSHLSETDEVRLFVQPEEGEQLPSLLKRCIPKIQTKRARAYHRLDRALRNFVQIPYSTSVASHREVNLPSKVPDAMLPLEDEYGTICAHVTEDLKICSEAILELRTVLSKHAEIGGPLWEADPSEIAVAIKWLDNLQDLEEKKLVCTVSKHALSRNNYASKPGTSGSNPSIEALSSEEIKVKVSKYARDICEVDVRINDVLQEMREYFLEQDE